MLNHPYDAYDKFEEISHLVKKTHLKIKDPKSDKEVNERREASRDPDIEAFIQASKALLKEQVQVTPDLKKYI